MANRLGPAHPRATAWNGAGAWLIFSQSRQLNFSRTVSTTFHWRGTHSSVRVTSSPSLRKRLPPQHSHAVGGSITTRSRGRCSGNVWRSGRARVNPRTVVVLGDGLLGRQLVFRRAGFQLFERQAPTGRSAATSVPIFGRRSGVPAWRSAASAGRSAHCLPTPSRGRPQVPLRSPEPSRARPPTPLSGRQCHRE